MYQFPELMKPVSAALLGKGLFADVIILYFLGGSSMPLHASLAERGAGRFETDRHRGEGDMKMRAEGGVMQLRAKECCRPAEAAAGEKQILPSGFQRECGPAGNLVSLSPGLQNWGKTCLWLESPSVR